MNKFHYFGLEQRNLKCLQLACDCMMLRLRHNLFIHVLELSNILTKKSLGSIPVMHLPKTISAILLHSAHCADVLCLFPEHLSGCIELKLHTCYNLFPNFYGVRRLNFVKNK